MSILKSPITWRLFFWYLVLSLIPVVIVIDFLGSRVQEYILQQDLRIMQRNARIYSLQIDSQKSTPQEITTALSETSPGDIFFLLNAQGSYLAHSDPQKVGKFASDTFRAGLISQIYASQVSSFIDEESGYMFAVYRSSLTSPVAVNAAKISEKAMGVADLRNNLLARLLTALLFASVAAAILVLTTLSPLARLAAYSQALGQGQFNSVLNTRGLIGELKVVAENLQQMAGSLAGSIEHLESDVTDRTIEIEHRIRQLRAVADVSKVVSSFRSLSELLQQTTYLISENFGYYHAGIFLLDERGEYAVLAAANSDGGKKMLERKHKLKVGEKGIVGYVTKEIQARIALDVGQDAVYFDNPDLPETRSEIALPLIASGKLLGALDVQSTQPEAFSDDDITTLQILADQVAIAIQNANLLNETEKALETARQVYGEVSREAWRKILQTQPRIGFIANQSGSTQTFSAEMEPHIARAFETGETVQGDDSLTISLPIKIRGQTIGAIRMKKSEIADAWSQDEINLAKSLSDQLSGALESARLYRESQQRAARESLVSDISARINAAPRIEAILRETVQEIGQTLGEANVTFRLVDTTDATNQNPGLEAPQQGNTPSSLNGKGSGT